MKLIRYSLNYFAVTPGGNSYAKYEAGKYYPITEETERHVLHGIAEEVEAPEDVAAAIKAAAQAERKADQADAVAQTAAEQAAAAQAAAAIAASQAQAAPEQAALLPEAPGADAPLVDEAAAAPAADAAPADTQADTPAV